MPDRDKTLLEKSAEASKAYAINNDDNKDEMNFRKKRETWTRIFIHRDALFVFFKVRDTCVAPPLLYPPL